MAKRLKPIDLFLSVGLAATIGACGGAAPGDSEVSDGSSHSDMSHSAATTPGQGGEGGEGGEGGASGDPDVDYMTVLALMKGHLMVAEELMAAGQPEQAEPHIGHPVDELYGDVETQLSERNVPQFKGTLTELHDLSKSAPDSAQMPEQFKASVSAIDGAIAAIPADQRQSPEFVMAVINRTLQTAAAEYEAAIANNEFVEVIEYQDSRGFVLYADQLYQTIADEMSQSDPEAHETISASLEELKAAWPSVTPPATPVKSPEVVNGLVSEIELQS
ncbi:hypothetical protein [Pseudanabaena sp. FACHB-2040]|uniref:hypothetical protein n=1 Tax=Pseudanabaena sp. FACHB-2040 TaxID=2692859 RepID=UPI0016874835|nr:hypothetical protein [Pseudanabaena sp. FACHB-2040]MBD2257059.1 hypothetical protein [Pseudanabaena sp. FACHB-2040]